jgi:hypothetical protein
MNTNGIEEVGAKAMAKALSVQKVLEELGFGLIQTYRVIRLGLMAQRSLLKLLAKTHPLKN